MDSHTRWQQHGFGFSRLSALQEGKFYHYELQLEMMKGALKFLFRVGIYAASVSGLGCHLKT